MSTLDQFYNNKILSTPQPTHISLNKVKQFTWNDEERLGGDKDTITTVERTSQKTGEYQLSGYDPSHQTLNDNVDHANGKAHFQKVYRNDKDYVDEESKLVFSESSNMRYINQLYTRPYAGYFCGAGMRSIGHKDIESALQQGLLTNPREKSCQTVTMQATQHFIPLPDYGNPQREEHIIQPLPQQGGWIRGGDNTRDYVRRIDYQRRCANSTNDHIIHKK